MDLAISLKAPLTLVRVKRSRPIDQLVRWAYRDELPKASPVMPNLGLSNAWNSIASLAALGQRVQEPDIRNRFGLVPDLMAQHEPHPDAVTIWRAVQDLADMVLTLPEDWNPLSDMGGLGPLGEAAIVRGRAKVFASTSPPSPGRPLGRRGWTPDRSTPTLVLRRSATDLVQHHAIMGTIPDWRAEKPVSRPVCHSNGQPRWFLRDTIITEAGAIEVEAEGMDRSQKRPKPGAYQKFYLSPDPAAAVAARAEYEIWIAAMGVLTEDLAGRLDDFEPAPIDQSRPWESSVNIGCRRGRSAS